MCIKNRILAAPKAPQTGYGAEGAGEAGAEGAAAAAPKAQRGAAPKAPRCVASRRGGSEKAH